MDNFPDTDEDAILKMIEILLKDKNKELLVRLTDIQQYITYVIWNTEIGDRDEL